MAGVSAIFMTTAFVGCNDVNTIEGDRVISTDEKTTVQEPVKEKEKSVAQEPPKETQNPVTQEPPKETQKPTELTTEDDIETFAKNNGLDLPKVPNDEYCGEWEFDMEAGTWRCNDSESIHYSYLYYGGLYYATLSYLKNNKAYKDYQSSKGFAGGNKLQSKFSNGVTRSTNNNGTFSSGNNTSKSGFGSGSTGSSSG
jgi:hypothetical protein